MVNFFLIFIIELEGRTLIFLTIVSNNIYIYLYDHAT